MLSLIIACRAISRACRVPRAEFRLNRLWGCNARFFNSGLEPFNALATDGDRLDYRHAQRCGEFRCVDNQSVARRHVDHVERNDSRKPQRDEFKRKAEMNLDIARIKDHHQRIRLLFACLRSEQDVVCHLFVGAGGLKAVCTRQVDKFSRAPVRQDKLADMAFNRHAGIVAGLLPGPGQGVEQGGFAGIGIAHQRDLDGGMAHAMLNAAACDARSAIVIRPKRTTMTPPLRTSSTTAPFSNPMARRRRAAETPRASQSAPAIVPGVSVGHWSSVTGGNVLRSDSCE